ncbi:protein-glucosylgalactosylhydroxylysine glucosidase isoform X1 [Ornithorhynchus anatinus]|nr:protein-glucosylgalactosylhydroxylysine glucosidase isoform X1 [Ornithorhynchus anatinus]
MGYGALDDPAVFTSPTLPSDPRFLATLTNSYLGTRVYRDILHVNGVYNGALGDAHRADVPSPVNVRLEAPEGVEVSQSFTLDTRTGTFLHVVETPEFTATHRIYAHRALTHLLAFSVTVRRSAPQAQPITVRLRSDFTPKSRDLDLHLGPDFQGARYLSGRTLSPEVAGGPQPTVHMLWTPAPPALTLPEARREATWQFLVAVAEAEAEVRRLFEEGAALLRAGSLYPAHVEAWGALWGASGLDLDAPLPLQRAVRGCLYYLLSAVPSPAPGVRDPFHGISPGGLSNGSRGEDYWGHVFWDQDLWMFPNILLLWPEAARAILQYRVRTLSGAQANARDQGYKGAKFPWESAATGHEVCPEDIFGTREIHINGAVLLAFEQYYYSTRDLQLFKEEGGWDVVSAVAEFWCSRVIWSPEEQCYHLRGVIPPDEYQTDVDNSVYTNVVARNSLRFATSLGRDLGLAVPEEWLRVAENLKVPFDPKRRYHPEYDGYRLGDSVKQADVVLLGFPVPCAMDPDVRKNDLEIYEAATSPRGPAMTWSMFAVGWLELREPERAQQLLNKCFANISEPFKIWTENSDGTETVNFLTGMGGFLQAVLFGYTGFRIIRDCLKFDPVCPTEVRHGQVTGVSYLGNKLNFSFSEEEVTVEVTWAQSQAPALEAVLEPSGRRLALPQGQTVSFPTTAGRIQRVSSYTT